VLGFSAAATSPGAEATTPPPAPIPSFARRTKSVAARISCVLIYPAYLTVQRERTRSRRSFRFAAQDHSADVHVHDRGRPLRVETALFYFQALKNWNVPAELAIFIPQAAMATDCGRTTLAVTAWRRGWADWPRRLGFWLAPAESAGSAVGSR